MPGPRTLFLAGLTLLAVSVGGALLLGKGHGGRESTPSVSTPSVSTSAVPPPPPPFGVTSAGPSKVGAYGVTLSWETPEPSTGRVVWGPDGMRPVLWADSAQLATMHAVALSGLASSTRYSATIEAHSSTGETVSRQVHFTTAPAPEAVEGATSAGVVLVNGQPFFPLLAWQECPDRWSPEIAFGIDLFAGNTCTGLPSLLEAVRGRALAAGTSDDTPGVSGPGLLGWFYPDEADARGLSAVSLTPPGAGLRFLTLTSHFFSSAAPLPSGRGMYPGLVSKTDVVGFDLYPLQELCRPELVPWVFDAQQELVRLAPEKPTFQWIEVREMKCPNPSAAVTPRTIRVESWLALAGGAHGLGFFPPDWGANVGVVVRGVADRIRQLEPALLQPVVPVSVEPSTPAVRASARELEGAVYVVAVNAGGGPAPVRLGLADLGDRSVEPLDGKAPLTAHQGALDVVLPPLSVRIYVAPPPGG